MLGTAIRVLTPSKETVGNAMAAVATNDNFNLKDGSFTESLNDKRSTSTSRANEKTFATTSSTSTSTSSRRSGGGSDASNDQLLLIGEEEMKKRDWVVDDFLLGKPIGKGKFGNVYSAKQKLTKHPVALKVLFKAPLVSSNSLNMLKREVEIQCRLKHPNIVRLFG